MSAFLRWCAWTSVYSQGLFFNKAVRVYKVEGFPFPSRSVAADVAGPFVVKWGKTRRSCASGCSIH